MNRLLFGLKYLIWSPCVHVPWSPWKYPLGFTLTHQSLPWQPSQLIFHHNSFHLLMWKSGHNHVMSTWNGNFWANVSMVLCRTYKFKHISYSGSWILSLPTNCANNYMEKCKIPKSNVGFSEGHWCPTGYSTPKLLASFWFGRTISACRNSSRFLLDWIELFW